MAFNSLEFLLFFPVVTGLYFALPHRFRWIHLLLASCLFYAAFIPAYLLILAFTIIIDYLAGIIIAGTTGQKRKFFLIISLVANIGVLAVFKYLDFISGSLATLFQWIHLDCSLPILNLVLPIGLSFHTFQAMSYTIEVYRGRQPAERHLGIYALYVMFFPQFRGRHEFHYDDVTNGLKLMLWGMFKKIVIADRLAVYVDAVYNNPRAWEGPVLIMATGFFAIQIYCDFSGYSDIAIGAARVMGFKLMTNFNRPYHARSVSEFWKRWHISLSTWFRDYLYIPLGGNRVSTGRLYFNLLVTLLISGLWHGAKWTFVAWGALNAFYILSSMWTKSLRIRFARLIGLTSRPALHRALGTAATFGLSCYAWILFRADNISDAIYINRQLLATLLHPLHAIQSLRHGTAGPITLSDLAIALSVIGFMELVHLFQRKRDMAAMFSDKPIWLRWTFYYVLSLAIMFLGEFTNHKFIYFQF